MTRASVVALLALMLAPLAGRAGAASTPDDPFIHGDAAALLEREFRVTAPSLSVRAGVVRLDAADLVGVDRARVLAALQRIRGVVRVETSETPTPAPTVPLPSREPSNPPDGFQTGWMPPGLLFTPLIADPRWPHFSAAYHHYPNDPDFRNVAAVSLAETFTLYRERARPGWWELGLQAGVFAVFDLDTDSIDLINADYYAAVLLGYRWDRFSVIGRLFHQSSHLGDEFLLRTSRVDRVNLSYEGLDSKVSWEFGDIVRLYGGAGRLLRREPRDLQPWSLQYGMEFRSPWREPAAGYRPIAAADVQHREENDWSADISLRAGVQFDGVLAARSLQVLLEYFVGHSPHGQFYNRKVDYFGIGAHFHF
jgi:hypothetical protein